MAVISVFLVIISLTLCSANEEIASQDEICVSRQEFESLKYDLHYWQNVTLTIIRDNIANQREEDQYYKEGVQALQEDMKSLKQSFNATHGEILRTMSKDVDKGECHPAESCKDIPPSSPSGHYWIHSTSTGYATMEYCHMSPPCSCNTVPGWMRVANLDMTDPNEYCPPGLHTKTINSKKFCSTPGSGCYSVIFPVHGVRYSKVCGKLIGYQYSSPDAFSPYYHDRSCTIDDVYVDGISLTHGKSPRSHIWTFVNALEEITANHDTCPCTKSDTIYTGVVPPFIEHSYFCDTGSHSPWSSQWYTADPLWDGAGCGETSTCCEFNSPPWFCKDLPECTTDDIEMRICKDQDGDDENVGVETVNIYIQ